MKWKCLPRKTIEAVWDYIRKYGYVCYYTGMALDTDNEHSPWYCVIDHWIPHNKLKVVITSSLLNDMKSDLSEEEFWCFVRLLADHKRKHTAVAKINLAYWDRDYRHKNKRCPAIDPTLSISNPIAHSKKCCICSAPVYSNRFKYCPTCSAFSARMRQRRLPSETVEAIWDYVRKNGYTCYYTGMPLEMSNSRSPWYCDFDHWIPCDSSRVVLTSALLNEMKSDLTEKEFWYYILQLDNFKRKHTPIRKKKLVYWARLNQSSYNII